MYIIPPASLQSILFIIVTAHETHISLYGRSCCSVLPHQLSQNNSHLSFPLVASSTYHLPNLLLETIDNKNQIYTIQSFALPLMLLPSIFTVRKTSAMLFRSGETPLPINPPYAFYFFSVKIKFFLSFLQSVLCFSCCLLPVPALFFKFGF